MYESHYHYVPKNTLKVFPLLRDNIQIKDQYACDQLKVKQPEHILCLGNVAVQSFFKDKTVDVKSLRQKIHHVHGYETTVAYHPLAVRRRPNLWQKFIEDWDFLAEHRQNDGH